MANRNVESSELRSLSVPEVKNGYDKDIVDTVIAGCADTIDDLETQIEELNRAMQYLRAQSAPMEVAHEDNEEGNDQILSWLNNLDPLDIDREVQRNIAEAIVGSTMAASQIRHEAKERIKILIDAVAIEVRKLVEIVRLSKTSLVLSTDLPNSLSAWEGEFSGKINKLLTQLELPWTVQVSELAKVINHLSNSQSVPEDIQPKEAPSKVSDMNIDGRSKTTSGNWG